MATTISPDTTSESNKEYSRAYSIGNVLSAFVTSLSLLKQFKVIVPLLIYLALKIAPVIGVLEQDIAERGMSVFKFGLNTDCPVQGFYGFGQSSLCPAYQPKSVMRGRRPFVLRDNILK